MYTATLARRGAGHRYVTRGLNFPNNTFGHIIIVITVRGRPLNAGSPIRAISSHNAFSDFITDKYRYESNSLVTPYGSLF